VSVPFVPSLRAAFAAMGEVPHTLVLVEPDKVEEYQAQARERGLDRQLRFEGSVDAPPGKAILIPLCLHTGDPEPSCVCKYHLAKRLGPPHWFGGAL
jgi:hypothetical protein